MFEISFRAREARRHQLLCAIYEPCRPRLWSLLSETVFRRKLPGEPICCRMNNCLNGRRLRHHYRENIIHLCCDGEYSRLYFSAVINAIGIHARIIMRNETGGGVKKNGGEMEGKCSCKSIFRRMRKRIKQSGPVSDGRPRRRCYILFSPTLQVYYI